MNKPETFDDDMIDEYSAVAVAIINLKREIAVLNKMVDVLASEIHNSVPYCPYDNNETRLDNCPERGYAVCPVINTALCWRDYARLRADEEAE